MEQTRKTAPTLCTSSKEILTHGSFNLRKFVTNSPSLQKLIGAQEAAPKSTKNAEVPEIEASEETYAESILPINPHSCPDEQMVLAVRWNVASDQLVFCQDGIVLTATQLDPDEEECRQSTIRWDFSLLSQYIRFKDTDAGVV